MFDVDSKDPSLGMSCPPPAFVEKALLEKVFCLLSSRGQIYIIITHMNRLY